MIVGAAQPPNSWLEQSTIPGHHEHDVRASQSLMHSIKFAPFAARICWHQFYFGKAASSVDTLPKKRHRAFILPTFRLLAARVAGTLWQSLPPKL